VSASELARRSCVQCGQPLRRVRQEKYCTKTCSRLAAEQRRYGERVTPVRKIDCQNCGRTFQAKAHNAKWCGDCRDNVYREKLNAVRHNGRFVVFARDGFCCVYCGRSPATDGVTLHADHVVPRDAGGSDELSNLVTACADCNLTKSRRRLPNEAEQYALHTAEWRCGCLGLPLSTKIKL
jgi:5-methylcytosine-specific restriction endonuclease McrA